MTSTWQGPRALAELTRGRRLVLLCDRNLARLHLELGGHERARELAQQSLTLSTEIGWTEGKEMTAALIGQMS